MGIKPEEYRSLMGQKVPRGARHDDPEHRFQCAVVRGVRLILPAVVDWTANAAGVRVTMHVAKKMKAAGVQRGWSDLQFLFPDAITRYLELKTLEGVLTTEQRGFQDRWEERGIWAYARNWDQVYSPLQRWCAENDLPLPPLPMITRLRLGL